MLRQSHSGICADMLRQGTINVAVGSGGLTGHGLQRQSVGESRYLTFSYRAPANRSIFTMAEFCSRPHLLISSSGLIGIVDQALAARGRKRRVAGSTSHFAAAPYLMQGTERLATVPSHAARALARHHKVFVAPCPLRLRPYPIEVGVNAANLRDPFIAKCADAIADCLRPLVRSAR